MFHVCAIRLTGPLSSSSMAPALISDWGIAYAVRVREDHALFVDAFREGRVGIAAT